MNLDMHGKLIDYIELNPSWTQHGHPDRVSSGNGHTLRLSITHHGDHDQVWIVLSKGGVEVARYNPSGVQHICWAAENDATALS